MKPLSMETLDPKNAIRTREELAAWVKNLSEEFRANPNSWDNNNLESFLDAMAAWIEDMDGYYLNHKQPVPTTPEWKTLALILAAARYYE